MTPLVSVIVPIYKVESYIKNCIDNIINQTYKNLEIILVDDESPDNCGMICDMYAESDPRIKVIHKKNGGLGFARNSGLEIATGDYVLFVDSDDWINLDSVSIMVDAAVSNNCDFVVGGFTRKKSEEDEGHKIPCTADEKIIEKEDIVKKVLYPILGSEPENPNDIEREMCVWTNMYKMSVIKDNGIQFVAEREYLSEDLFFNINYIMNSQRAILLPYCFYNYRLNNQSLTNRYRPERFVLLKNLYHKECEILSGYAIIDELKNRINRTFIMKTRNAIRILLSSDGIKSKEKRKLLKEIVNDGTLNTIVKEYPIEKYRLALRIPAVLIKNKCVNVLIFEQKLRAFLKKIMR